MTLYEKIDWEDVKTRALSCIHCAMCRQTLPSETKANAYADTCPAGLYFNFEAFYSPGRNELARAIVRGEYPLKDSERLQEIIYSCTTCGACEAHCKYICDMNVRPTDLTEKIRARLVKEGIGPLPAHKKFAENCSKRNNPYGENNIRNSWFTDKSHVDLEHSELFYFVGCTTGYRMTEIGKDTTNILNHLKTNYTVSTQEMCCGSPLLRTGQLDEVERLVKHNVDVITKSGAKTVLVSCAGCYRTIAKDWPEILGRELPFTPLHVSEYLSIALKKKKFKFKKPINEKVVYHDPCHLGRHMYPNPVYEQPRHLIDSIPGIERKIFYREKDESLCCAAGGGVKAGMPEYSEYIASLRVDEARAVGAETIITPCPFCIRGLSDGAEKEAKESGKSKILVKDLTQLINEALGGK